MARCGRTSFCLKLSSLMAGKEWYCRLCSETNVWSRAKCERRKTTPAGLHGKQQVVSTRNARSWFDVVMMKQTVAQVGDAKDGSLSLALWPFLFHCFVISRRQGPDGARLRQALGCSPRATSGNSFTRMASTITEGLTRRSSSSIQTEQG